MENYVGKRLDGRYEIQEIVGVGGMAVVYKAYDSIDDRTVAVKILKDEFLANEEFRRRFKNESKAIAVLAHPNIVKVYDVSYGDKLQYIVMEYVEGITLKEYIEHQGTINPKEAVHFVTQILRALQHAHDKGIVHRDVKPQNIMLLQNGNIKVTDFGIARFSRNETKTMTDGAIGSVHYISPEQARGDITDDKADIYSVGVVVYEMLTGKLPFESDSTVSVAIMQLQNDPIRPRNLNPAIPAGLEQITMRAMQKNPRERYQSAAEMLLDLEEFKRNPAIVFNYGYYVDKEPTKYIDPAVRGVKSAVQTPQPAYQPETEGTEYAAPEEAYEEEYEPVQKNKTVPILVGVGSGLVVLALVIVLMLYFDPLGIFVDNRVEVPNFMGMNYYNEIQTDERYADLNIVMGDPIQNSNAAPGTVVRQDPGSGTRIEPESEITLTLVAGFEYVVVPEVAGKQYSEADDMLTAKGFKTTPVFQYNTSLAYGTVIETSPAGGLQMEQGSTVTIYIATDKDDNAVKVPDLVSWNVDIARDMLKAVGLLMDDNIVIENSAEPEGTVIGQVPDKDTNVAAGSSVKVTVSSGIPESSTATVTFALPTLGTEMGLLNVFIDNDMVAEASGKQVLLNGNSYSVDVTGTGSGRVFTALVDNTKIFECTVDFTSVPPQISGQQTYPYIIANTKALLPDVVDMSLGNAKSVLINRGFTDIHVMPVTVTSPAQYGTVISQDPKYELLKYISTGTKVTLYVGEEATTASPVTPTPTPTPAPTTDPAADED